jgi:hypothetical protein
MKEATESRHDLEGGIENRKKETDSLGEHMGLTVEDKKRIAQTARELDLGTTREGAEALKKELSRAAEKTNEHFEKHNQVLDRKLDDCKKAENDFFDRFKKAQHNEARVESASQQLKEALGARQFLDIARRQSRDDAGFMDNSLHKQRHNREQSHNRRENQKNTITNTQLPW